MSTIFDRLARLARAEFNHVKAVMSDRDDDAPEDVRAEGLERLRRAREELERAEAALKQARQSDGAAAWGSREDPAAASAAEPQAGGADAWGKRRADSAQPAGARAGDTGSIYTAEVRMAYAALEIPMGGDPAAINEAYRRLLGRYHPDKHAANPKLLDAANELTRRIREARDLLLAWHAKR